MIVGEAVFIQVGGINDGLEGKQLSGGDDRPLILIAVKRPGGVAVVEPIPEPGKQLSLLKELLVPLGGGLGLLDPPLHHLDVGHDKLDVNGGDVPHRVHRDVEAGVLYYVHNVLVVEATHHMDDGGALPDVSQELVAQARALAGPLHQASNVHKLNDGRGGFLGGVELAEPVQTAVGHRHHPHVGVDGAERIVGALGAGVGDGVKQSGLAHVGQPHNAQLHKKTLFR